MILDQTTPTIQEMYHGSVDTLQVQGINALISSALADGIVMKEQIAYILATAYHETGRHMQGINEYGEGKGHTYGIADPTTHKVYYGRGIVQLTWKSNYERFGQVVGVDLVHFPERANELEIAVKIAIIGMKKGMFTGVSLDHFINEARIDYVGARKIINGVDCNTLIANYAEIFAKNLHAQGAQVA